MDRVWDKRAACMMGGAEGSKSGHLGLCVALPFIGQVPLGKLLKLRV